MIAAGDRLRDLREDKGKTQAEISSLLGTTQQIYSRYETNRTDLPLRHLIKLADYYQVSADYILGRTSYPKNPPEMAIDTIDVQKTAPGIAHMQRLGLSFIFRLLSKSL